MLKNIRDALRRAVPGSSGHQLKVRPGAVELSGKVEFEVEIEPDELDGGFIARCVNLPGAASQGETPEEALENLGDAIAGSIAARLDRFARDYAPALLAQQRAAAHGASHVRVPLQLLERERVHA